ISNILTTVLLVPAQIQAPVSLEDNRLGNGGFESWPYGQSAQGPIAPQGWYANGSTANFFTQSDIFYTRRTVTPADIDAGASGQYYPEITTFNPGNFIAQNIENFGEFKARPVTFSVSFRSVFPNSRPKIEIDDGVTNTMEEREVGLDHFERLSVRHMVAKGA